MQRQRRLVWIFLASMLVIFALATWSSAFYINWLWFANLGFAGVFWRSVAARAGVGMLGGLVFGGIISLNVWLAGREGIYLPPNVIPFPYNRWLRPRGMTTMAILVGLFFGLFAGASIAGEWLTFFLMLHKVPFGKPDPLFHQDISFFVFTLPALGVVYQVLATALFLALLIATAVYAMTGRVTLSGRWPSFHPWARNHLLTLLGLFLILKSLGYILSVFRLVYSVRGVAFGASYTDVHVDMPALKALAVISFVTGVIALINAKRRAYRLLYGGVATLVISAFVFGKVLPGLVQQFVVKPNEIAKETEYIRYNIAATRDAYNLNRITEKEFPVTEGLTWADVRSAKDTVGNVRLWDWRVLKAAYQQLQGIRRYYRFHDVDVDRYNVGGAEGGLRQVLVSAREIDYRDLPEKTWINQYLKYTHGYGIVMSPASEVTPEGLPLLWLRDIPPAAGSGAEGLPRVERPEIYFGEMTNLYAIVNTGEKEFDYPQGDRNEYAVYKGRGGIPIGGLLQRLAFAVYTGDYNVLLSRAITADSRVLLYRNINERVNRIAPFLLYDHDPYIVLSDGRLYWIRDAYTITGVYPYSEHTRIPIETEAGTQDIEFNYIRNSVKVVVDAYNGDTTFYVADDTDPLIKAYQRVFPNMFKPLSAMPADLRSHLRYPEDLFLIQAEMYGKYHMQDPVVFYNKEDQWERPQEIVGTKAELMDPYYVIMQLPGEDRAEYLLMMPFTLSQRPNMIAWLAARSDGDHYGELVLYKFPKHKVVLGPTQVEALINQDEAIAEKMTLWGQQGAQVLRGNLLVIPIKDSIMYVEPIYLQSTNTRLPEMKRVIGVYRDRVKMEETLDQLLDSLFPEGRNVPGGSGGQAEQRQTQAGGSGNLPAGVSPPGSSAEGHPPSGALTDTELPDLAREAGRLYREAQEALRQGDWGGFGQRMQRLGEILGEMESRSRP